MPANPQNIKLLLQKRAIRAINKANYNSHTESLFKRYKILKLNDLYELKVILFVNDFIADKLPMSYNNIFSINNERPHFRNTRQSNLLYQERCRSKFSENMPLCNFPQNTEQMVVCVSKSTYISIPLKIQHDGVTVS